MSTFVAAFAFTSLALTATVRADGDEERERALAIAQEVEQIAGQRSLWPGFTPLDVPLAIFTGEDTYLFRHPSTPEGFVAVPGDSPKLLIYEGRHPAMTANSSAEIGDAVVATVIAPDPLDPLDPAEWAAVALHEAFHVFQRQHHPNWIGNEGDLFLYPFEDGQLLAWRRLETEALRRALIAPESASAACWARRAMEERGRRFAAMGAEFSAYERGNELNEGLASYVQLVAAGKSTVEMPASGFPATEVRQRGYVVGPAFGFLLDRFQPSWKQTLETQDETSLDHLLDEALSSEVLPSTAPCPLSVETVARIESGARADVAAVAATRAERSAAFAAKGGWRLTVLASEGLPLWPEGFDPLNVEPLTNGLLHTRFLKLGNDGGHLEMIDQASADLEALTVAAGEHPLFHGVAQVTIVGLVKPAATSEDGQVTIRSAGFELAFQGASLESLTNELIVRLQPSQGTVEN